MTENFGNITEKMEEVNENKDVSQDAANEATENLVDSPEGEEILENDVPMLGNAEVRRKEQALARAIQNNYRVKTAERELAEAKARERSEKMG